MAAVVTRVMLLRAGFGALAFAFLSLAGAPLAGLLLPLGLLAAFAGAGLWAFSRDELAKWAGIGLLTYFGVSLVTFLAATPVTIRLDFFSGFLNAEPSRFASELFGYLILLSPLMLAAAAAVAAWEHGPTPRYLLIGATLGFVIVGFLTIALTPNATDPTAAARATTTGNVLASLLQLVAVVATVGAIWAASRSEAA